MSEFMNSTSPWMWATFILATVIVGQWAVYRLALLITLKTLKLLQEIIDRLNKEKDNDA